MEGETKLLDIIKWIYTYRTNYLFVMVSNRSFVIGFIHLPQNNLDFPWLLRDIAKISQRWK